MIHGIYESDFEEGYVYQVVIDGKRAGPDDPRITGQPENLGGGHYDGCVATRREEGELAYLWAVPPHRLKFIRGFGEWDDILEAIL